jgi:dihydroneopterin aldolase
MSNATPSQDTIIISELAVSCHVGVSDAERSEPQRLLVTLELTHDLAGAARTDDLAQTIDYYAVAQRLLHFGEGRSWKLIEKLAADLAEMVLREFGPKSVKVEVKKMAVPEASFVAVRLSRERGNRPP